MLAPLLKEVRIPVRLAHDALQGVLIHSDSVRLGRFGNGASCSGRVERTNLRKIEQTLRIRLGFAHVPSELGEPCPDQRHRKATLCRTVQSGDERRELSFSHILKLINEQDQCCASIRSGCADGLKQRRKVVFQIAVVGQSGLRLKVESHLNIAVLDLECLGEARQTLESTGGHSLGSLNA